MAGKKDKAGRNDPCPCGSGKKAKRCCLAPGAAPPTTTTTMSASIPFPGVGDLTWRPPLRDQPTSADLAPECPSPDYVRHSEHVRRVLDLCDEEHGMQLGVDWLSQLPGAFVEADYASYHLGILAYEGTLPDGRRILDWALGERGEAFSPEERAWLEAEQQSCTSVWEVLEVVEGERVLLLDRLRAEKRTVHETVMTYGCEVGWFVCARVTEHEGRHLYCGLHPQPLQAEAEESLFRRLRERFGEGGLGPELLRREVVDLLRVWEDTYLELRAADEEGSAAQ